MIEANKWSEGSLAKDSYFVAVKALIRKDNLLLITHDIFDAWDIPGGRIRADQFEVSLEEILRLKIEEELGKDLRYELGDIVTTLRVERKEVGLNGQIVRIFGVCYEAKWLDGEPRLGDHHDRVEWIDLRSVNLEDYGPSGGWVSQLTKYQRKVNLDNAEL